jgi:ketosteroid isomerase-like protein
VQRYTEGFCSGDLTQIVSCLAEDVVWAGGPTPQLYIDRLIEERDTVAVVGHGSVDMGSGEPVDFVYSEVFTFRDDLVSRLDTFHVWLGEVPAA